MTATAINSIVKFQYQQVKLKDAIAVAWAFATNSFRYQQVKLKDDHPNRQTNHESTLTIPAGQIEGRPARAQESPTMDLRYQQVKLKAYEIFETYRLQKIFRYQQVKLKVRLLAFAQTAEQLSIPAGQIEGDWLKYKAALKATFDTSRSN